MRSKPAEASSDGPHDLADRCKFLLEHLPQPIIAMEGETHLVRYINPAFSGLSGKKRMELLGRPFAEAFSEGEKAEILPLLDRVYRTGKPETATRREQGKTPPAYWSYAVGAIFGANKRPVGLMIQVTDATEINVFRTQVTAMNESLVLSSVRQHELTEAAESLNRRLQLLLNAIPVGVMTAEDPECRVITLNPAGTSLFGVPFIRDGEVPLRYRFFHQSRELKPEEMPLQLAVSENRDVHDMEIEAQLNGNLRWTGLFRATPLHDHKGKVIGGIAVVLDITQRKEAEKATAEAKKKLEATLHALPDILFEVDRDGRIYNAHVPDPQKLNISIREYQGHLAWDVLPSEAATIISQAIREAESKGPLIGIKYPVDIPGGEKKYFEFSIAPVGRYNEADTRFIVLARDITDRHVLEENINRLRREQESFLRHEMKNLFAPLQIFAELLLQNSENLTEEQAHYLQRISESSGRVSDFIDSLKNIHNIEARLYPLKRTKHSLDGIIRGVIANIEPLAGKSGVTIQYHGPEGETDFPMDVSLMPGVFSNLLLNAIEHVAELKDPHEKIVSIDFAQKKGQYSIRINNKGTPISTERLATFFDKFNVGPEKRKGTGLGTTYAFLVIRAHGGDIRVSSTTEEGTTVVITLPKKSFRMGSRQETSRSSRMT